VGVSAHPEVSTKDIAANQDGAIAAMTFPRN
jgi:hypothetical protein